MTFGAVTQTFDNNGNLLTQTEGAASTSYTWDARNRLTQLNGPSTSASFAYDAIGRRLSKTISGAMTTVLYDGLDSVKESGAEGDVGYLRTLNIDEALSRRDASGGAVSYVSDILGSTLALTDTSGTPPHHLHLRPLRPDRGQRHPQRERGPVHRARKRRHERVLLPGAVL